MRAAGAARPPADSTGNPPPRCDALPRASVARSLPPLPLESLMSAASSLPVRTADGLSTACTVLGFASIVGSIVTWAAARGDTPEERAHGERFGIFVGLWAPTFFILADHLGRAPAAADAA